MRARSHHGTTVIADDRNDARSWYTYVVGMVQSVSYTHLDVYKRQPLALNDVTNGVLLAVTERGVSTSGANSEQF